MDMTIDLLATWLFVMKFNDDYTDYSEAVKTNNAAKCKELEGKFGELATLYADWGNIESVTADVESDSFKQWLMPRESLFFVDKKIKAIITPSDYKFKQGHLLLDIPLLDTKTKTVEAIRDYINKLYDTRETSDGENPHFERAGTVRTARPKYQLVGEYNKKIEGRLHKAFYFRYWLQVREVARFV